MIEALGRFRRQSIISFKALFGWLDPQIYLLVKVINPIFQVLFFSLIAGYVYNTKDLTPWVIGNSFLLCIYNAMFGVGMTIRAERFFGTLKLVIASPANKFSVFVGRSTMHIFDATITVIIGLITGYILFGLRIPSYQLGWFFLTIIIAMFAACGLGLFIGSIGLITRDINLLLNVSSMLLLSLSGANFPITRLPIFLQKISAILPLSRTIEVARRLVNEVDISMCSRLLVEEVVIGLIYMVLGFSFLKIMEKIAIKKATIDIY